MTTAKAQGLLVCHTCEKVYETGPPHCHRCGTPLHPRLRNSIQRTWAMLAAGIVFYVPANVYPIMSLVEFGQGEQQTILSGTVNLYREHYYGIATIILVCSFVVPILKIVGMTYLLVSVQLRWKHLPLLRARIYRFIEVIGRWSMLDIFVLTILTALVRFGYPATVIPGVAATAFAAVVVCTMLAAITFDPRLIWDAAAVDTTLQPTGAST